MSAYYFDSSAVVKLYVVEDGTEWVSSLLDPPGANDIYTVRVTGAEVVAALTIRTRTGTVTESDSRAAITQFKNDFHFLLQLVDVTDTLVESAMLLAERHALRGYDAIQLASALAVQDIRRETGQPAIDFVSADGRLDAAATAEGPPIENPMSR